MNEHKTSIHGSPENAARMRANLGLPDPAPTAATGDEGLIEGAAKAIMEASHGRGAWELREPMEDELYKRRARAALAVFEKAHTPTDDEREALDDVIRRNWVATPGELRNALIAAGFRRSVGPEPSAEEWAARINAAREKAIAKGYTPEHDAKHGVRHLLRWAIDYARRGRGEDSAGLVAAAIDLADIAYAELERLRHVADTMRAVSEALRTRYASDSQAAYFMREIDAALEAAPQPQGERSDAQALEGFLGKLAGDGAYTLDFSSAANLHNHIVRLLKRDIAALRAASAVTEQGERS